MSADQTPPDVEAIRARLDAARRLGRSNPAYLDALESITRHVPRLLDENARLNTELAARDTRIEALSEALAAKNRELDKVIQGSLDAGAEWASKMESVRAERDEAIREAAADKAALGRCRLAGADLVGENEKLKARVAELEELKCAVCGMRVAHLNCNGHVIGWGCADGEECKPAPEMPRPPAEEGAMAPDEETEDAIRGQHQTTVRGGNWVSHRCDCREWELEVPAGLDAMPRLKAAHAEHVAEMVAEGARLAAQKPVSGPETAGTGSGRGTGVTEAQASDG